MAPVEGPREVSKSLDPAQDWQAEELVTQEAEPRPEGRATESGAPQLTPLPNEIDGVNTDGRPRLDWISKYEHDAVRQIRLDAAYIGVLMITVLIAVLLTWKGTAYDILAQDCANCSRGTFNKYAYFFLGGHLGGVLFGVKYLYKVVARGYWNMDRRLWRLFSPFLSGGLALVVGALLDSGVMGLTVKVASGAAYFSYGFITGYFADRAIDKLQEVAETVFGAPGRKDPVKAK